jgi:hypothetical protein
MKLNISSKQLLSHVRKYKYPYGAAATVVFGWPLYKSWKQRRSEQRVARMSAQELYRLLQQKQKQ